MLKLRNVGSRDIDEGGIRLDDTAVDEGSHAEMVALDARDALELAPCKDQGAEVFVNGLEERLGGCVMQTCGVGMLVASVAVDANVVSEVGFPRATKRFDGEDIALFHTLVGLCFDEWDLLVAVDAVAQDVVPSDVSNGFHRNHFSLEFHFVALHYFLDGFTDVIDPGINTSFLKTGVRHIFEIRRCLLSPPSIQYW